MYRIFENYTNAFIVVSEIIYFHVLHLTKRKKLIVL